MPSSTPSAWPSTTAPIVSSSRLSARPSAPPSNSRSSFTAALGSPATRAMPSPTSSTRPTRSRSIEGWNPSTCFLSAAVISAELIVNSGMTLVTPLAPSGLRRAGLRCVPYSDRLLQLREAVAHGSVDHGVADGCDDAAEHLLVDDDLDLDALARRLARARRRASAPARRRAVRPTALRRPRAAGSAAASSTKRWTIATRS